MKSELEVNKLSGKPGWVAFSKGAIVATCQCPLEGKWRVTILGGPEITEEFDSAPASIAFIRGWFMGKAHTLED